MSTQTLAPVDAATYRAAVAHHAAGVAVVTSAADGRPVGLTVSSFTSHSIDPPTVSCDLAVTTRTLPGVMARFTCELAAEVTVGDHAVVFGTVSGVTLDAGRSPLIHQARGFHILD